MFYAGPILDAQGKPCMTSADLDHAMLATRGFWFEAPIEFDPAWLGCLESFSLRQEPFPSFDPPSDSGYLWTVLNSKDSVSLMQRGEFPRPPLVRH